MDESADIALAVRRLLVRLVTNPTLELALSILVFSLVGWVVAMITGEAYAGYIFAVVGAYDIVVGVIALLRALIEAKALLRSLIGR